MTGGLLLLEAEDCIDILESGEPGVTDVGVCDLLQRLDARGMYDVAERVENAAVAAGLIMKANV